MKRLLLLALLIPAFAACRHHKKTTSSNGNVQTQTNVSVSVETGSTQTVESGDINTVPLVVKFISKGEGIDLTAKHGFEQWLAKNYPDYNYNKTSWGREGEISFCFAMNGKSAEQRDSFIMAVKEYTAGKELILFATNTTCDGNPLVEEKPTTTEVLPADTGAARLVVSFISKGEGIDYKTKESFEKWLSERPDYTYETHSWGREGEVNFCFRMTNLSTRQQEIFVRDVRTFLNNKELVLIQEWATCSKR